MPHSRGSKTLINYIVTLSTVTSFIALSVPLIYDLLARGYPSDLSLYMFLWGCLYLAVGEVIITFTYSEAPLTLVNALYVTISNWLIVPVLVAVPVTLRLGIPLIDTWFEAVSGLTTTGLSVFSGSYDGHVYVPSIEELPPEILLWRSFLQWMGGLGIVVFMITILARAPGALSLYYAEGRFEKLEPSIARTVREMALIYVVLTSATAILLVAAGMPVFDAVNHAMTALSTGGFSTKANSIAEYGSRTVELATIVGMMLGASSFLDHKNMLTGRIREYLRSIEVRTMAALLAVLTGLGVYLAYFPQRILDTDRVWTYFYQIVSAITTTGFQTMDIHASTGAFKYLVIVAMLIGGSVFSTAGGVKLLRIAIAFKALKEYILGAFRPKGYVSPRRLGRYSLTDEMIYQTLLLIFVYTLTVTVSALIIAPFAPKGYGFMDSFFEAASALATTGLSSGISSASAHVVVKLVLIIDMLLGRLEVMPFVIGLYSIFSRKR